MRISQDSEALPPMPRRWTGIETPARRHRQLSPGILLEDKGYSLALHPGWRRMGEGDLRGGVPDQGRSAECTDRSTAGEMRLRDQAFRLYQGNRRPRTDGPRTFKGRCPIFIGDDVTDEAVFGIMPDLWPGIPSAATQRGG
jgi:trehalose 6-phosphate phosphatase